MCQQNIASSASILLLLLLLSSVVCFPETTEYNGFGISRFRDVAVLSPDQDHSGTLSGKTDTTIVHSANEDDGIAQRRQEEADSLMERFDQIGDSNGNASGDQVAGGNDNGANKADHDKAGKIEEYSSRDNAIGTVIVFTVGIAIVSLLSIGCGVFMLCKKDSNPDSNPGYSVAISNRLFKVRLNKFDVLELF